MQRCVDPSQNRLDRPQVAGDRIYSVNALAIRNTAELDEEFDRVATHGEFPELVPSGQICVADKSLRVRTTHTKGAV